MQIAEVRGMLTYIAAKRALWCINQYTPLEVKVAITGYGKSDKRAVAHMVERLVALPKKNGLMMSSMLLRLGSPAWPPHDIHTPHEENKLQSILGFDTNLHWDRK
jgi:hypothetical protein